MPGTGLLREKAAWGFSFVLPERAPCKGQETTAESVPSGVQLLKEAAFVAYLRRFIACFKGTADKPFLVVCGSISDVLVKMP